MQLKPLPQDSQDKLKADRINEEAFPPWERNSLDDLYGSDSPEKLDMLGIYDDADMITGFLMVRIYENIRYLAYLAVSRERRSEGIGSSALQLLRERYDTAQIVVELETPDDSLPDNALRLRRRDFYLRNGFYETGWYSFYDDTEFTIACSQRNFDKDGFEKFIGYLGTIISDHIPHPYRK